MSVFTQTQVDTITERLAAREAELHADVRAAREEAAARPSAQGPQVDDAAEHAEQRFRRGVEHIELQRDQEELQDIADAKARIANASYGECVDCGCSIPWERLAAQPAAKRCIADQTRYERTHPALPHYTA